MNLKALFRKKDETPKCSAVIVAAGSSQRMGTDKVFMKLGPMPVLVRTVLAFQDNPLIEEIIIVTRKDKLEEVADLCHNCGLSKVSKVVIGGSTRMESALAGVSEVKKGAKLVAIHDGARPLILPEQVDEMVRLGRQTYAAAPALPVTDTVKVADTAGLVQSTPDRRTLFAVQTPQVFQANILKAALQSAIEAGAELTDDCSAVERLGKEVYLAPGWRENIKITTASDLTLAEALLRERENRA